MIEKKKGAEVKRKKRGKNEVVKELLSQKKKKRLQRKFAYHELQGVKRNQLLLSLDLVHLVRSFTCLIFNALSQTQNINLCFLSNLSLFIIADIDLKVASKFFGTKFACGSSVTGDDEIVIQGDVKDDLFDVIPEKWPEVSIRTQFQLH